MHFSTGTDGTCPRKVQPYAPARRNSLWLAVESIESPGNLGTLIRTAEAAGASGILVLGPDCDPHDPATVRAIKGLGTVSKDRQAGSRFCV
jgi:tRNA G18 (ribose-2'-O)-methylase SpoU